MSWNASQGSGANWYGSPSYATKTQLISSVTGLYANIPSGSSTIISSFKTLYVSTLYANYISSGAISTGVLVASSINGEGGNAVNINLLSVSTLVGNVLTLSTLNFAPSLSNLQVSPTITLGSNFGQGIGNAVVGGLTSLLPGVFGVIAGTAGAGVVLNTGLNALTRPRVGGNINGSVYEEINGTSQLQISTLGNAYPYYSTIYRFVSSTDGGKFAGMGKEYFVSTIFPANTKCIRTAGDPEYLLTAPTSSIQAFSQWVPLLDPDSVLTASTVNANRISSGLIQTNTIQTNFNLFDVAIGNDATIDTISSYNVAVRNLQVSSINNLTISSIVGVPIQSTVVGLGTAGYISSSQLTSTVRGLSGGGAPSNWSLYPATQNVNMSNFSNINWAGGNRTGAITINNATNNVTLGNSSGITMTTLLGDIQINNSSGATVVSNSADVIALTTTSNNIQLSAGADITLSGNNVFTNSSNLIQLSAGSNLSFPGSGVVIGDFTPTGSFGIQMYSQNNGVSIVSGYGGVAVYDGSPSGVGPGVELYTASNDIYLYSGGRILMESSGFFGTRLFDYEATGTGIGILLNSYNNPININAGRGINLSNISTGQITINNDATTSGGVFINDTAPASQGGIALSSQDNNITINAGRGINLSNISTGQITINNSASTSGGVFINDTAPALHGGITLSSQDNSITLASSNGHTYVYSAGFRVNNSSNGIVLADGSPVGFGGVVISSSNGEINITTQVASGGINLAVTGGAANVSITTFGSNTGLTLSNAATGGKGTFTVSYNSNLYWNGNFVASGTPPPSYANFLLTTFYENTGVAPDTSGPSDTGGNGSNWGSVIQSAQALNPVYYGNYANVYPAGRSNYQAFTSGYVYAATEGQIQFSAVTDDGTYIEFNGTSVLPGAYHDQDVTQYTSALLTLPAGYTPIRICWYNAADGGCELLYYSLNGGEFTNNGTGVFYHSVDATY